MTRFRDSIKHAESTAWPEVKKAVAESTTPVVIDKLARTKQSRSNVRFVVEATIQSLAMNGLLRTPVDADVIGKAVSWHEAGEDAPIEVIDEAEADLDEAVERLLAEVGDRPHA